MEVQRKRPTKSALVEVKVICQPESVSLYNEETPSS